MPVTLVVGGQFGGEGKGKVAHFLAREMGAKVAVRVGGSNSGHTVVDATGTPLILRQLPTPSILPDVSCVLGAGSYIDVDILFDEIARTGLSSDRLYIDSNATVITQAEIDAEKKHSLRESIGSTQSGTRGAILSRVWKGTAKLAKDDDRLKPFIRPVVPFMRDLLSKRERIIIEGTQGFGLSLLHSPYYPYVTSRDTSASAFVSEAGLSPMDVDEIVLVIRTYPIRVGGNSGPLPNEISWELLNKKLKRPPDFFELTSVTKTVRRIAEFDAEIVRQAILVNQPTQIVLNHLDYIEGFDTNKMATTYLNYIENIIGNSVSYFGISNSLLLNREELLSIRHAA